MSADLDRLATEKYVLLTTFRKDGSGVPTPVWAVQDGGELKIWTADGSGKVKRIRRDGTVEVAACDARGKPHGDPVRGTARLLDAPEIEHILDLLKVKYGIVGRLIITISRLRRGIEGAAGIGITVPATPSPAG